MGTALKTELYPYAPYVGTAIAPMLYLNAGPGPEVIGHKWSIAYVQPSELDPTTLMSGAYCQYRKLSSTPFIASSLARVRDSECDARRSIQAGGD